jgi:WD40 repeat protein
MRARGHDPGLRLCAILLGAAGCLGGVYTNPLGRSGNNETVITPALSGRWASCGSFGTGGPWKVAISADGSATAVLFRDGRLALHRTADGALIASIRTSNGLPPAPAFADPWPPSRAEDVALSDDGAVVAVADGRHVAGWRVADAAPLFDVPGVYAQVRLSPAGERFLTWKEPAEPVFQFELRSAAGGALIHADQAGAVGFSANGAEILTWRDHTMTASSSDEPATPLRQVLLSPSLTRPVLSPDGRYLAAQVDSYLQVFQTVDGVAVLSREMSFDAMKFSADGSRLLMFAGNGLVLTDVASAATTMRPLDRVRDAAVGPHGAPLFVADVSGLYRADGLEGALSEASTLPGQGLPVRAIAVSPDGAFLAVGSDLRSVPTPVYPIRPHPEDLLLWDPSVGVLTRTFSGTAATSLQFSQDGLRLLVVDRHDEPEGRLQEWPLDSDAPVWSLTVEGSSLSGASYGPDQDRVVVSFADGVTVVKRGATEAAPAIARKIAYPASAFSPDGMWIATSGLALWRADDLTPAWTTGGGPPPPIEAGDRENSVAFSPDGKTILSSSQSYVLAQDVGEPLPAATLNRSSDGVQLREFGSSLPRRPAFSPDGRWIVARDVAWEIASGRMVGLHADPTPTSVSVFLRDGRIALAREDGIIELFCPH